MKKDPNIVDMERIGTVVEYRQGYYSKGDSYVACGIVKEEDGEMGVWALEQPLDYESLVDEDRRWSSPMWESGFETPEELRARFEEFASRIDDDTWMDYEDMVYEVDGCVRYKGYRYSAWEPNY